MPMSAHELDSYLKRLQLPSFATEYIRQTRNSPPARTVESVGVRNTPWRYPSRKMGWVVSLESTEEHALAIQMEFDGDVLEYWDQPPRIAVMTKDVGGRARRVPYVPDLLCLGKNDIKVIQVKTTEMCQQLTKDQPARWSWKDGQAHDHAAYDYFKEIGLEHVVHVGRPEDQIKVENYELLLRVRAADPNLLEMKRLIHAVAKLPPGTVMSLRQLMLKADIQTVSSIIRLIDGDSLFSDLSRCRLSVPSECIVSTEPEALSRYCRARDGMGAWSSCIEQLSDVELIEAHRRLVALRGDTSATVSARTLRRWRRTLLRAKGDPLSLRPGHYRKGNREKRLSDTEESVCSQSIQEHYLKPEFFNISAAYSQFLLDHSIAVRQRKLPPSSKPISYPTFRIRCLQVPAEIAALARSGNRAAAAAAKPIDPTLKHLSPTRVFGRVHIDHYLCDLHVIADPTDTSYTKRPWLTALRDQATGVVLAFSISFRSPSRLSCLAVLRDCSRRHGRLPEVVVVDNGAEFHSSYFEIALVRLGIAKQSRPPGCPRFGGIIEGWFKSAKSFLYTLEGNTANDMRPRSASNSHKGRRRTTWDIYTLYSAMEDFIFNHFNNTASPESTEARSVLAKRTLTMYPESGQTAPFTEQLLAITAIPLEKKFSVDPFRGVRHLDRWFVNKRLFDKRYAAKSIKVYEEPWDKNRIYVLIDGELITCYHGSNGKQDLSVDFAPGLDSVLLMECPDVRARQAKRKAKATAKLTRKWGTKRRTAPAPRNENTTDDSIEIELPPLSDDVAPYPDSKEDQ